ncbi:MAG: Zn-ribbon domain-containing OB-fold protein [Burkholderiales bacterium]
MENDRAAAPSLKLQRCLDCGRYRYPAARYCPRCRGERSEWVPASGGGVVESHCVFHKAYWPEFQRKIPYAVVQVKLDEGVLLFSNLVGVPREQIRSGMRVRATFEGGLVKFVPT